MRTLLSYPFKKASHRTSRSEYDSVYKSSYVPEVQGKKHTAHIRVFERASEKPRHGPREAQEYDISMKHLSSRLAGIYNPEFQHATHFLDLSSSPARSTQTSMSAAFAGNEWWCKRSSLTECARTTAAFRPPQQPTPYCQVAKSWGCQPAGSPFQDGPSSPGGVDTARRQRGRTCTSQTLLRAGMHSPAATDTHGTMHALNVQLPGM